MIAETGEFSSQAHARKAERPGSESVARDRVSTLIVA